MNDQVTNNIEKTGKMQTLLGYVENELRGYLKKVLPLAVATVTR